MQEINKPGVNRSETDKKKKLSLLLFSGDYDKAMAALILANSAKEMDIEVSIFFTFWGLCLIRDPDKLHMQDKNAYEKMFGYMAPAGPEDLPLSNMNMAGIGKAMLKEMMKENETPLLSDFLRGAQRKGIEFYACKLAMEVMGLHLDEMIEDVKILTAQEYLLDAMEADVQLFI